MKNFTKQITNKTLFKPTRWLLMALMLLLGTGSAWAKTIYLLPNNDWKSSNAWFAVWAWGAGDKFYKADKDGDYYKVTVPDGTTGVQWFRMSSSSTHSTDYPPSGDNGYWNRTGNVTLSNGDLVTITGWDSYQQTTYTTPTTYTGTIKFKRPSAWKNIPKIHMYTDCGEVENGGCDNSGPCNMTLLGTTADGSSWYEYSYSYTTTCTKFTVMFNNGGWSNGETGKTVNDYDLGKSYCLTSAGSGQSVTKIDCPSCFFNGIRLIGDESQLNLGDVEVGQSKTVQIEFEYCGITGITPQFLNIQSGFSGSGSQDSNNRTITYNITFAPTEAREKTATIYIAYANGGLYKKTVTANGVQSCQSANVAIDDWNIPAVMCKNVPATFTYSAEANAAVTWSTDNANFNIVDNNKTVTVTYTGDAESSNNVLKYTVSETNGFCPVTGEDSGKKLSAQGGVQIEETTETDQTVCPQGTTTIGVTAGMTSYVWKYGEQVMNGKTTNSIEVGAGNYSVTATNANGCVSNVVNFTVTEQEQPITDSFIGIVWGGNTASEITACSEVTLKFWATGATRYEIYENIGADSDLTNDKKLTEGTISGDGVANAITYDISKNEEGTYKFYAKVSNECTSKTLNNVTLTVPATIAAPGYTLTEPTKCGNSETPGSLAITQVEGISYTIDDIVRNNLTLEAADHIQPKTYTITATQTTGSCTRTATTEVTVQTINNTPVVNDIAITTANTTVCAESELTLQLVGDAQDGVSFQWYKDEDAIVGATSSSLTIQNVTASDAGDYKLVASKTTPCTVTKESKIITISVDAQSKIKVSAAESFCLGIPVNLASKVTDATGEVTWYTDQDGTQVVDNTNITVSANATYYAKAQNGVCPATDAAAYSITAKGATISRTTPAGDIHPYEVTTFTASGNASWQISTNPSTGTELGSNDPVFSGKTTAYITKADGTTTTFKGEVATGYTISATAEECTTTQTFDVVADPNNCQQ